MANNIRLVISSMPHSLKFHAHNNDHPNTIVLEYQYIKKIHTCLNNWLNGKIKKLDLPGFHLSNDFDNRLTLFVDEGAIPSMLILDKKIVTHIQQELENWIAEQKNWQIGKN